MNFINHQDTKAPREYQDISAELDIIGRKIVDCAFQVHSNLGPGLLESIYEEAFSCELQDHGLHFETQKQIPIQYKNRVLKSGHRLDMIVENQIIVELKACEKPLPVHDAQILTYLKLTNLRLGYLINFNVPVIKQGIKRKAL